MIIDHLRLAETHVAEGEHHVARQRELVAELDRDGHDTSQGRRLLLEFEELQAMHIADRNRLLRELAEDEKNPS
ncbi:MAG TPA: hypothetical protein VLC74_10685 [Rhizomicrobium sp.]|nr:hypothetical protein [Rhizomicrobium sp.]